MDIRIIRNPHRNRLKAKFPLPKGHQCFKVRSGPWWRGGWFLGYISHVSYCLLVWLYITSWIQCLRPMPNPKAPSLEETTVILQRKTLVMHQNISTRMVQKEGFPFLPHDFKWMMMSRSFRLPHVSSHRMTVGVPFWWICQTISSRHKRKRKAEKVGDLNLQGTFSIKDTQSCLPVHRAYAKPVPSGLRCFSVVGNQSSTRTAVHRPSKKRRTSWQPLAAPLFRLGSNLRIKSCRSATTAKALMNQPSGWGWFNAARCCHFGKCLREYWHGSILENPWKWGNYGEIIRNSFNIFPLHLCFLSK